MSDSRTARTVALVTVLTASGACTAGTADVFSLQPGECFDEPDDPTEQLTEVAIVDCEEPHDNQVYALFDVDDGEFPGDEVAGLARDGCIERFEDHVGFAYADAELFATWLYPSSASWDDGDREVICVLFDEDRQLEGVQQGAGR